MAHRVVGLVVSVRPCDPVSLRGVSYERARERAFVAGVSPRRVVTRPRAVPSLGRDGCCRVYCSVEPHVLQTRTETRTQYTMHNLTFPLLLCVFSGRAVRVPPLSEAGAGSGDTASSVPQTTLQAVLLATSAPGGISRLRGA